MNGATPATGPRMRWPRPGFMLALGLVVGYSLGQSRPWVGPLGWAPAQETKSFRILPEAWRTIQANYVDRTALVPRNLAHGAVAGMVAALGDVGHSTFVDPGMLKQIEQTARGQLQGVGVEVQVKDGKVTVVSPLEDSPAARAGIRPGDIILKVNGTETEGLPLSEVAAQVSGAPGSSVTLTLVDPSTGARRDVTLTRAAVRLHSVHWAQLPGTRLGQIRLSRFDEYTATELRDALAQLEQKSAAGLILDLRNNPGGVLDAAVAVASQFLTKGNVLIVKDAHGARRPVPVINAGKAVQIPMVILVNGASASAAEIVAGALKDAGRARLVGEKTFGTGTVLQDFRLSDGSALLLAVQEWLTPRGYSFWHKGIVPDVTVSLPENGNRLKPESVQTMTPEQLKASGDHQLLRAVEILQSGMAAVGGRL